MSWQIYACGDHTHQVHDELPPLKSLTEETSGKAFRRIGRFIQLALIGASRCALNKDVPSNTAVYFASARGDLELTLEIMTQLYREGQTPKPLNFVNTVSNAACFYVAQHLQLQARSNFVCNRYFAFESAVQLALLDLTLGNVSSALVGSVDIATAPLSEHRQRLQLSSEARIGEGSHWLWLGIADSSRPRLGELMAARHFDTLDALLEWKKNQGLTSANCQLALGQFVDPLAAEQLKQRLGLTNEFSYRSGLGYYDSQSGAAISHFLANEKDSGYLLHVNSDTADRYSLMLVKH